VREVKLRNTKSRSGRQASRGDEKGGSELGQTDGFFEGGKWPAQREKKGGNKGKKGRSLRKHTREETGAM